MRTLHRWAAAASLAALTACASGGSRAARDEPPFYRPEVGLREVRFAGAGIVGGSLDVVLRVYNPNDYALASPRVAYRVLVESDQIASGLYDVDATIPPGDSATLRVPASFTYRGLGRAGLSMTGTGAVSYRVIGDMALDTPYGRRTVPFDRVGRFAPMTGRALR